jgi:hypothetical protein
MRRVVKTGPPRGLLAFVNNPETPGTYATLRDPLKSEIRAALARDQGGICVYCSARPQARGPSRAGRVPRVSGSPRVLAHSTGETTVGAIIATSRWIAAPARSNTAAAPQTSAGSFFAQSTNAGAENAATDPTSQRRNAAESDRPRGSNPRSARPWTSAIPDAPHVRSDPKQRSRWRRAARTSASR